MVSVIPIFCTICLILVQLFSPNIAQARFLGARLNITNNVSQWNSEMLKEIHVNRTGRSKRSLFDTSLPELKIHLKYPTGEEIDLQWIKTKRYLANEYLPVITSSFNLNPNVMHDVGDFVVYHDKLKCSAVVYFEKANALYGVIGINYYIESLPFDFDENGTYRLGVVGQPYVQKHDHQFPHIHPDLVFPPPSDTDAWVNFVRPNVPQQNYKRPSNCDGGPSTKHHRNARNSHGEFNQRVINSSDSNIINMRKRRGNQRTIQYFSETLIFVTRDIVDTFKTFFGNDDYLHGIVGYYIIYFNAVDMFFRKLRNLNAEMHINIAKIVIEDDSMPFEFIGNDELQFSSIVDKSMKYLQSHPSEYKRDSFDHVFIHTSRLIKDDIVPVNGLTKHGQDMYGARKVHHFYDVVPITVVRYQHHIADYPVTVHEIARTFGMKVDPHGAGWISLRGQCSGIMQREGPKCVNCLKWREDNVLQFFTYINHNRNRCFLLNKPRSLEPPGPSRFVSAHQQCQCFGYDSHAKYPNGHVKAYVGAHRCHLQLQCQINVGQYSHEDLTVLPFDGTPCTQTKVCWDGQCVPEFSQQD